MKKVVLMLLCALMLVGLVAVSAFAADEITVSFATDKTEFARGDEVTYTVSVSCNQPADTLSYKLEWDAEAVEIVSGECTISGATVANFEENTGGMAAVFANAVSGEHVLGTVTLRVKENAPFGPTEVKVIPSFKKGASVVAATAESIIIDVVCPHANMKTYDAVEPGCETEGNIAYQQCQDCGFAQTAGENPMPLGKFGWILGPAHKFVQYEEVKPTCSEGGNIAYEQCSVCGVAQTLGENPMPLGKFQWVLGPVPHKTIKFDAVEPGCHSLGNVAYWFCPDCEGFWLDEACTQITNSKSVILPAKGSDKVEHVAAVEATCDTDGNIEYWYCAECEGFWQDEALTQLTNSKRVIVPALGHTFVDHEAVAPTCSEGGNIAYQQCSVCGYAQTAGENPMPLGKFQWILGTTEHALVHMEAVEPGCHSLGNVEYWFCPACEGFWLDEACTQITNSKRVILPAKGSDKVEHVAAVAPDCENDGNFEYWHCAECEGFWLDEACTRLTNAKSIINPSVGHAWVDYAAVAPTCSEGGNIAYQQCSACGAAQTAGENPMPLGKFGWVLGPVDHTVIHFEAQDSGCHSLGNTEYWFCPECEGFWADEELTQITNSKNVLVAAKGSENMEHFEAVAPTCHGLGNIEYWFCPDCEAYFQDEACTQLTNSKRVILPELGCDKMVHVEAVAATTEKEGNIEYWYCPECKAYFQDEACTQLTNAKRVITPKLEAEEKPAETPTTGDATPVAALVVLSVLAVAGMALVVTNKKKFSV